ncbi:MAG TPA: LysR family transcriptional regulator [Steroidobacteraceae bacterium]|nr:LysR family transcriptional regulator [Steroidobacteraceae bacterium]
MRNVTIRQIRVFAAVARNLSFTRAARELHLTQPAVSQQVSLLEAEVGMPLFEQIGRTIRLAPAGAELLRYATQVTELLREAGETLAAMKGLKRGELKLGAVSTAKYFAPKLLSAFTPAYPEVAIKFTVANREEIVRLLAANELDLVIMGRPPRELDTKAEPFARHPLVIIASLEHPLAHRRRIPLKSLARESFIIREQGSGTRASMEHVFRERGVSFRTAMEVSSNETIKQAVMAGMGLSFISSHTIGLEVATGKLAILDVVGLPVVRDWYVIHQREKILSPIASAFRGYLLENGARVILETVGDATRTPRPAAASPGRRARKAAAG